VRDATDADITRCAEIYGHHVATSTVSFETEPPSPSEIAVRREASLERGLPWIVAERAGHVVGFAYASPWRLRPAYDWTVEDTVYIDADATRQGVGTALLAELIARCTASGRRQMIGVIGGSAIGPSVALHESLGFRRVGVLPAIGWKHGTWLDVVLVQRALGDGDATPPG